MYLDVRCGTRCPSFASTHHYVSGMRASRFAYVEVEDLVRRGVPLWTYSTVLVHHPVARASLQVSDVGLQCFLAAFDALHLFIRESLLHGRCTAKKLWRGPSDVRQA
jgi:hypothetical protein